MSKTKPAKTGDDTATAAATEAAPTGDVSVTGGEGEDAIRTDVETISDEDRAIVEDLGKALLYAEKRAREQGSSLVEVLATAARTGLGIDLR